ncbi:MAG: 1-deoxy-D-xylulose-5-phosphate synthase [Alphaproteobacteria bacterium]
MTYLDRINSPQDVKKLSTKDLNSLAIEIRDAILYRDSKVGGHVGPNLGFVEATIALHYVFNSPQDKIVFDVSHQCYPHKMLTGRKNGFLNEADMKVISGYTNPKESEHDFFSIGHTSTSVSLACGLAKARDLKGEKHNVIAVIGDGSLSGGEALEGLNNAAVLGSNIIIVVNDNEMSIAENHGGLYTNLRQLRESNGNAECNLFKALGFEYTYLEEGNDIERLIEIFTKIKDTNKPILLHVHTNKGNGYRLASEDKEPWHWSVPFNIETGEKSIDFSKYETYGSITTNFLCEKIKTDKEIVLINAGTPGLFALPLERRIALGANYVDVGIAEEHAVAFSSALAKGGCKPVFMVHAAFIQRTYDQLSHDLALNENPAVILVFNNGISGADMTHLGVFDIPLISNIPNIIHLAPTNKQEYLAMLNWGLEQKSHPVVIRVPSSVTSTSETVDTNYDKLNTSIIVQKGNDVAILALGSFFGLGEKIVQKLETHDITPTLINPRFISGLDEKLLTDLANNHKIIITLEDGELDGGFGEKVARFYGPTNIKVLNFGAKKEFTDRNSIDELYQRYHLTPDLVVEDILKIKGK